jgi:hypothetical protein
MEAKRERLEVGETSLRHGHSLGPSKPIFTAVAASPLLQRLEGFLPSLKSANDALQQKIAVEGPSSVDIESVDSSAAYVAMDVALTAEAGESGDDESEDDEDSGEGDFHAGTDAPCILAASRSAPCGPGLAAVDAKVPPTGAGVSASDCGAAAHDTLAESLFAYAEHVHQRRQGRALRVPQSNPAGSKGGAAAAGRPLIEEVSSPPLG